VEQNDRRAVAQHFIGNFGVRAADSLHSEKCHCRNAFRRRRGDAN
jgi:hypothetical protein